MLQEIARHIPTADRSLRSVGLMRVSRSHDAGRVLLVFTLGALIGVACTLLVSSRTGREVRSNAKDTGDGLGAEIREH